MRVPIFVFLNFVLFISSSFAQGTQLLRQPSISPTQIVFVHANDLWVVDRNGGDAQRLTSNEGAESNPHFSEDGSLIAFTGQYDGNTDVYVVPAIGGSPKRLTYHPSEDFVQGWTPEGDVLFRSGRESKPTQTNAFYTISLAGGLPKRLDIPRAAYGEISNDGNHVAYTPITSWDAEWRNYRGGQAMPIWIVNQTTKELIRTPQPTKERHLDPVWVGNEVYFLSERDYASNIWSFNPETEELRQQTFHSDFDVKSLDASANGDAIIYEQGGYLHLLLNGQNESTQLEIRVRGDLNFARSRWEDVEASQMSNYQVSPNGKRALFEYRGEIFTVPKEDGNWRNISNSPGVADRHPIWSPKGDQVAWFSDQSGEYELVVADQFGDHSKTYPLKNPTFFFKPDWSSDGKYIAYTDTDYNIWYINLWDGEVKHVDTDRYAHPNRDMNPIWSPDSRWIAYSRQLENHFKAIFAYNIESGEKIQLTDGMADATAPIWDQSGAYLYFLASTDYGLQSGWLDMSSYDPSVTRSLYLILLDDDAESPLLAKSDEELTENDLENDDESKELEETNKNETSNSNEQGEEKITISAKGLQNRIIALGVEKGEYSSLQKGPAGSVLLVSNAEDGMEIKKYEVEEDEVTDFLSGVRQISVSFNGLHTLYRTNGWNICPTTSSPTDKDGINTTMRIKVDPRAEYQQIFKEAWRYMRDFLYVENVHGAPWDEVWSWYSPWIDQVQHRTDLNYVLDILSGEVSIGHSYVAGGDMPDIDRVGIGLLGADYAEVNGYYQVKKIYNGESWNPDLTGPLALPGLDVNEGDYLVAVNGQEIEQGDNLYAHFEETVGRQIRLTVNTKPGFDGSREVVVIPTGSESALRRFDWIEGNRRLVDEISNGKLAYVYVPNTSQRGFTSFNRYYFAQQDRKGVVIDERNNGGGSAADYMIDIMSRKLFGYFNSAAGDRRPWTTPIAGIWGPKVMIINERAGSGGDLLPYMFRAANLGPLIGTRTWGGLVGTWDTPRFIDGGRFVAPRGGFFDVDGEWAVEGEGIAPDIEVIQDPKLVTAGKDPQLEAAIEEAMRLLESNEFIPKEEPAAPIRYKRPGSGKN